MATLWIREFTSFPKADVHNGSGRTEVGVIVMEPGTDQTPLSFTTSAQSAAFADGTRYIMVISSAAFHFVVGDNPIATTGALKVPADTLLPIGVRPGQKIAAIVAA